MMFPGNKTNSQTGLAVWLYANFIIELDKEMSVLVGQENLKLDRD